MESNYPSTYPFVLSFLGSPKSHMTHLTSNRQGMWDACPCLPWHPTFTLSQSGKIKIFFKCFVYFPTKYRGILCCGKYSWHSFNVTFALCPWRILTVSLYFRSPINVSGADRKGLFPLLSALRCRDRSEMGDMNSQCDGIANTDHNITLFVSTEQAPGRELRVMLAKCLYPQS